MKTARRTTFDTYTGQQRSKLMAKIKSKDTKPELILRKALFRDGLRYRTHRGDLPGRPDISVEKYKLIIEVRGCFWHGHDNCADGHTPRKNSTFWKNKLSNNKKRDKINLEKLTNLGYTVFIFWECEVKRKAALDKKLETLYGFLKRNHGLCLGQGR